MSYLESKISYHLSSKRVTNKDLSLCFTEINEEDIFNKTGIKTRYQTEGDVVASDLGYAAANNLFREKGLQKKDIDYLIFISSCLDYKSPTTACILQNKLGLNKGLFFFN